MVKKEVFEGIHSSKRIAQSFGFTNLAQFLTVAKNIRSGIENLMTIIPYNGSYEFANEFAYRLVIDYVFSVLIFHLTQKEKPEKPKA